MVRRGVAGYPGPSWVKQDRSNMSSWADYKATKQQWITLIENPYYPDYLQDARSLYEGTLSRFKELVADADDAASLLRAIADEPGPARSQLVRVFRRYVAPDLPVQGLQSKPSI